MEPIKKQNKRSFGSHGEELAVGYLKAQGYHILNRNYRVGRMGEIDIIASQDEYICFIEVKTRTSIVFGTPGESVDRRKQENIRRLAWTYLKQHYLLDRPVRFDIAEVTGVKNGGSLRNESVNLIKNAF